jgi:ParB family chromosome partitioning protein
MRKKRSLGRCLGDILEEIGSTYESSLDKLLSNQEVAEVDLREIEIDKIEPNPYQPRKRFDEDKLLELSASIKSEAESKNTKPRKLKDA